MTPAEEDALVASCSKPDSHEYTLAFNRVTDPELIRLAIRAAVAQERERCAKVCERYAGEHFEERADECAAAIRRGE